MQVLSDGRVRRTASEWEKILERQQKSRLPIAAFCEKEEISRSAFASWKRRLSEGPKTRPAFIELARPVVKSPALRVASVETSFELALPGGVTLRWKG